MTCNSNIINFIVYPSPLPKKSTIVISSSSSQVNGYWSTLLYMCRAARIRNCWLEKMSVHVQHLVFHYVNNYLDSVKKNLSLIINILQMIGQSATLFKVLSTFKKMCGTRLWGTKLLVSLVSSGHTLYLLKEEVLFFNVL